MHGAYINGAFIKRICKKRQKKLFIDFEKAYDKVPCRCLFDELRLLGCGRNFIAVLARIYSNVKLIFKTVIILCSIGVRQGAATSVLLFIIFLDRMVKMIKDIENDDFLKSNHALLLMDDTVLFASSRERLVEKLRIVQKFCYMYGMSINVKKTQFMVINNNEHDKIPIISQGLEVKYCTTYVYLGSFITDDANCRHSIELYVEDKRKHVLKFSAFLSRIPDLPFSITKTVAEACVLSSLLYGCETWICKSYGKLDSLYMNIIKLLLGVRKSTCNDLCLIESGMPALETLIQERRSRYFKKVRNNIEEHEHLKFAFDLISSCNSPANKIISDSLRVVNWKSETLVKLMESIGVKTDSSKRSVYLQMNPSLETPTLYTKVYIPEFKRLSYTRIRLSAHNLRIELGRW